MNCFCKKYFDDKELNKLVQSVSFTRREPFYQVLISKNITQTKELYYNYNFMKTQDLWIGNPSNNLKVSEIHLIDELCLYFQSRVRLKINLLPYQLELDRGQYKIIDVILFGGEKDGKKTFINALCTYMKGVKERVTNLGQGVASNGSENVEKRYIIEEQELKKKIIEIRDERNAQNNQQPLAIKIHLIDKSEEAPKYIQNNEAIKISAIFYLSKKDPNQFTKDQQNFIKPILKLLPKDSLGILYHIITFADFKDFSQNYYQENFQFLYNKALQFENQSVFSKNANLINNYHFDKTWESFNKLIDSLSTGENMSISEKIRQLQNNVDQITQFEKELKTANEKMKKQEIELKDQKEKIINQTQIMTFNSDYEWETPELVRHEEKYTNGRHCANCKFCQITCCQNCDVEDLEYCGTVGQPCPCNCPIDQHCYEYIYRTFTLENVKKVDSDKLKKYESAQQTISNIEDSIKEKIKELNESKDKIKKIQNQVLECQKYIVENSIFFDQPQINNNQMIQQ